MKAGLNTRANLIFRDAIGALSALPGVNQYGTLTTMPRSVDQARAALTGFIAPGYNDMKGGSDELINGLVGTTMTADERAASIMSGGATLEHGLGELLALAAGIGAGEGAAAESGGTTLYRAVSHAEYADITTSGVFRPGPNSYEFGKFFAESGEHAAQWGRRLEGAGNFRVIEAQFPSSTANQFLRWDNPILDNIGAC